MGKPYELACNNNPNAIKIVYLTECAPNFSYKHEKERVEYYYKRHKKRVLITRSGKFFNNKLIKNSNYGIFFGNQYNKQSFYGLFDLEKIFLLNPTGLINRDYIPNRNKNFEICKRNFLWFGSTGAIHKGLDILLDVFSKHKDLNLYIAGLNKNEKWLLERYKFCKNIIDCGFIDVYSKNFIKLMNDVAFVILPSASEGMATSVLTCMKHGLIPIVTQNVGIDTDNFGITLEEYKVKYIENKILEISMMKNEDIYERYCNLLTYVKNKYELHIFEKDFSEIINKIL